VSILLALGPISAAHAGNEIYLRWDNCLTDGGTYNRVFACDTNSGTEVLVGSFRLDEAVAQASGLSAIIHLASPGYPTLPAWWSLRPAGCRPGSLTASFTPPATSTACVDRWQGMGIGGVSYEDGGNVGRILVLAAVPAGSEFAIPAGQEIFAFQLRINHARTVGAGSCAGCSAPVCIGWGEARITPSATGVCIMGVDTPDNGSNVTWQPGGVATTNGACHPIQGCCGPLITNVSCFSATPALDRTWGSIKTLYR
jgi:hypothetical protein